MINTTDTDRYKRLKKTTNIHHNMEINKVLSEIIDDFPDNPDGMKYFYDKFRTFDEGETIYPGVAGKDAVKDGFADEVVYAKCAYKMIKDGVCPLVFGSVGNYLKASQTAKADKE